MSNSVSKELAHVKELVRKAKYEDALQRIEHIEKQRAFHSF